MIKLKWKNLSESFNLDDIAQPIMDFLTPRTSGDYDNLYHGKGQYFFLPDFKEYVNKGKDFFNECKTMLSDYFFGNASDANTYFQEYLLEQTPEAFVPFMQNVLTPEMGINVSNLYNPNNVDMVNLDNVWQTFGFDSQGQFLPDSIITIQPPDTFPMPIEESGSILQSVGETIGGIVDKTKELAVGAYETVKDVAADAYEIVKDVAADAYEIVKEKAGEIVASIGDTISNIEWGDVAEKGLSILGSILGGG